MKKYSLVVSEQQLLLIAKCLEDISRFASGQSELQYTVRSIVEGKDLNLPFEEQIKRRDSAEMYLKQVKHQLRPDLSLNGHLGYNGNSFIGNTYQIYRSIYHRLAIDNNWNNVYSSETLPSGDMGSIRIDLIE